MKLEPSHPLRLVKPDVMLDCLRRVAKTRHKVMKAGGQSSHLTEQQNYLAEVLGWENWSLLARDFERDPAKSNGKVLATCERDRFLREALVEVIPIDDALAEAVMENWVRVELDPLVNWAYYDAESENGYAAESVELDQALGDEFGGTYPDRLIQRVAARLEREGPWGDPDMGIDDDEQELEKAD